MYLFQEKIEHVVLETNKVTIVTKFSNENIISDSWLKILTVSNYELKKTCTTIKWWDEDGK
jgi:hypothetical protein